MKYPAGDMPARVDRRVMAEASKLLWRGDAECDAVPVFCVHGLIAAVDTHNRGLGAVAAPMARARLIGVVKPV